MFAGGGVHCKGVAGRMFGGGVPWGLQGGGFAGELGGGGRGRRWSWWGREGKAQLPP